MGAPGAGSSGCPRGRVAGRWFPDLERRGATLGVLFGLIAALAPRLDAEPSPATRLVLAEGLSGYRLLGPATALQRGVRPGPGLVGDAGSELWLTSGPRAYEVRSGRFRGAASGPALTGLAVLAGELLAVRGRELLAFEGDLLRTRAVLPDQDMRIEPLEGDEGLLLYGGRRDGRSIFVLLGDGRYERLVEADAPVTAALEAQGEVVFACGSDLWLLARLGTPVKVYTSLRPIFSLARRPGSSDLWFATPSGVFSLSSGRVSPVLAGTTGFLRHDGRYLIVSDPVRRSVLALSGFPSDAAIEGEGGQPRPGLLGPGTRPGRDSPGEGPGGLDFMR